MCLICQEVTTESLKCPLHVEGSGDKSKPYSSFLKSVHAFRALGTLPVVLTFGEDMTVDELVQNQGSWHKSCYVKFSKGKLERAAKKRERGAAEMDSTTQEKRPRCQSMDKMVCLFCHQEGGHLHEFRTLGADESIRQMAIKLQETELLARIGGGDLIALEAKYHLQCLTVLRNRYHSLIRQQEQKVGNTSEEKRIKAKALVELYTYIENCVEDGTFCFKFSVLHQLYEKRVQHLGIDKETNRSLLKEKVLAQFCKHKSKVMVKIRF